MAGSTDLERRRHPVQKRTFLIRRGLPGDKADDQARYIEAGHRGRLHLPAQWHPQPGPKFQYKLTWFDRLIAHAQALSRENVPVAVMPNGVRARPEAPVAVPITWEELRGLDSPAHWHVGGAKALVKRAGTKALISRGRADQVLPGA